jgi:hypothetical protein
MQDRMMKSLGPLATVAGPAEMFGKLGSVAKGSVVGESFGFAKSLDAQRRLADSFGVQGMFAAQNLPEGWAAIDEAIAAQKRMEHSWTHYGAAAIATGAGMHKTPGMTATIAGYGSAVGGVDQLGGFASGLVGAGLLAKLDETIAGMHKGSMDLSSLMTAAGGIAGMRAATAGFSSVMKGVDPLHGVSVPMGIGGYPSMSGVVAGQAMPPGGSTEPTLVVPTAAESALILDWLRDHAPTPQQAASVCDALNGLWVLVALVEAEAHINPSPVVLQTQVWSVAVLWILHFLLHRAKPHD